MRESPWLRLMIAPAARIAQGNSGRPLQAGHQLGQMHANHPLEFDQARVDRQLAHEYEFIC